MPLLSEDSEYYSLLKTVELCFLTTCFFQVEMCKECIQWAKDEKRTFLRQALEVCCKLSFFYCIQGHSTEMSTQNKCRLEIVYDSLLRSLSILLLTTIGAKLIVPTVASRSINILISFLYFATCRLNTSSCPGQVEFF